MARTKTPETETEGYEPAPAAPSPKPTPGRTTRPSNDPTLTARQAFRGTGAVLEKAFVVSEASRKVARRLTREAWRAEFEAFVGKERR